MEFLFNPVGQFMDCPTWKIPQRMPKNKRKFRTFAHQNKKTYQSGKKRKIQSNGQDNPLDAAVFSGQTKIS